MRVLKNKNLLLLILGQFVSGFGTMMQSFALSLYVLQRTGSATLFASVLVAAAIPRIVLTPFAGVLADRFSRKKMIVIMDLLSALSVFVLIVVFQLTGELSMVWVYVLTISLTTINVFFTPAMGAIIPDIVEQEQLAEANSIREMGNAIVMFASPLIAGLLFGALGLMVLMILNAVSFLLSAISEMFIDAGEESIQRKEDQISFFSSFKQGLTFIKGLPEFIIMMGIAVLANFSIGPIFSVALPVVLLKDFGVSEELYGTFLSLITIGMLVGPMFAAKIIKRHHYSKLVWIIISSNAIVCGIIALLTRTDLFSNVLINVGIMVVLINILMVTIIWVNLAITTARQILVPGHMMGRVGAVLMTFSLIATPLGQALMGSLLDWADTSFIIGMYSVLLLASGILAKVGFAHLVKKDKMDITIGVITQTT